jgi:hypothetical protein
MSSRWLASLLLHAALSGAGTTQATQKAPSSATCGVSGRLPPESIQRVIHLNFGRFRGCYQDALLTRPKLSGRIDVSFVILRDGTVTDVTASSDTLGETLTTCIGHAFEMLEFPKPDGGIVSVKYPLVLSPR